MEFKVGNWVRHTDGNLFQVKDIFRDGYTDYVASQKLEPRNLWDTGLYCGQYDSSSCTLWQPKVGEWCWYPENLKTEVPSLICFDPNHYHTYACEPFIGTLPSFITSK